MCKASVFDSALWAGVSGSGGGGGGGGGRGVTSLDRRSKPVCSGPNPESCAAQIQRPLDDKSGVGHLTNPS